MSKLHKTTFKLNLIQEEILYNMRFCWNVPLNGEIWLLPVMWEYIEYLKGKQMKLLDMCSASYWVFMSSIIRYVIGQDLSQTKPLIGQHIYAALHNL